MLRLSDNKMYLEFPSGQPLVSSPARSRFFKNVGWTPLITFISTVLWDHRAWLKPGWTPIQKLRLVFHQKVLIPGHHKDLPQVFRDVPLTRLLVETDSAATSLPQVRKPRVSTPFHAIVMFKWLTALHGLGLGTVLRQVAKNYHSFYLIDHTLSC